MLHNYIVHCQTSTGLLFQVISPSRLFSIALCSPTPFSIKPSILHHLSLSFSTFTPSHPLFSLHLILSHFTQPLFFLSFLLHFSFTQHLPLWQRSAWPPLSYRLQCRHHTSLLKVCCGEKVSSRDKQCSSHRSTHRLIMCYCQVSDSLLLTIWLVCSRFVDLLHYSPRGDHSILGGLDWVSPGGVRYPVLIPKLPLGCGGEDGLADHDPPLSGQHLQRHQQQLTQCQGRFCCEAKFWFHRLSFFPKNLGVPVQCMSKLILSTEPWKGEPQQDSIISILG